MRKTLFENNYISLFSDKTIGLSDGVGFLGSMEEGEVKNLYLELHKLFNHLNN